MELKLTNEKVRATISKNNATSFGLTLIAGLPFSPEIGQQVQRQLEALAPDRFTWYGPEQLHTTLVAPLRGRYREGPPLHRAELPSDLDGFISDLAGFCAQIEPFMLDLVGVQCTEDGFVVVSENTPLRRLAASFRRHPELDRPKYDHGLHVAIGYLNSQPADLSKVERARLEAGFAQIVDAPIGRVAIDRLWLAHYASRTLSRIVGKVAFPLGQPQYLTSAQLLEQLNIGDD